LPESRRAIEPGTGAQPVDPIDPGERRWVTALAATLGESRSDARMRWVAGVAAVLVVAFVVSVIVRPVGSYYTPTDGWGLDLFELTMGAVCIWRYLDLSRGSGRSAAPLFPLVLGAACCTWALGDVAVTIESLGGATVASPSVADGFYLFCYPMFFAGLIMVVRRGNSGSLIATSLDGLIVGLAAASLSAAFLLSAVLKTTGGSALSAATQMAYPVGDLLLLALAIGGLAILPKGFRWFLVLASVGFASNAIGDTFNLLAPTSRIGFICNASAWPISLFLFAVATWAQPAHLKVSTANASEVNTEKTAGFALPTGGALAGIAILIFASVGHAGHAAIALATATLFVAGVRLAITVRQVRALSSARFRSLIDNAWDLIVVAEADLQVAFITPSSERVLGYSPANLTGTRLTEIVHPDDSDSLIKHLRQLVEGATETVADETRVRHQDGAWRTIAWTATNLLDDPSVRGYVLNGSDVTETRQAVEDLATARDGALAASKAKSEFLSTMSHEIRTPMNGVIGLTELLLGTTLDSEQHEFASGIKVSAENLLVIINGILDFSRIEAGKLDIEEVAFAVPRVAEDVGRILAEAAHSKGLELLIDVHPDVPTTLLGDVVRVKQVLLNLGSNAVKFTSEGEVLIRVGVLHENAERVALRFDVIDQGIGIAESDQQRLFRTFTQADSSTTRKFGGTGLGLSICRQLVDLMGGKLGLISAPGEGSTFWFELSLKRANGADIPDASLDPKSLDPNNLIGQRALIVDDNATNRRILLQQFLSVGVVAVAAVDAYQALELAAAAAAAGEPFDLAVIDLNMPGMDGMELADHLKANPATAPIILFLLSSSGERLGTAESHLRGFAGCMTKPVRSSELFDCLITGINGGTTPAPSKTAATPQPDNQEVMGMILLVEDNTMNQLVASKVLAKLGYEVEIANHGGEAVSAVQAGTYDAILMDCQMPEMDGYEATGEIRRIEGTARRTPIIAMTAAAMAGDRETCIAAGMDDYITKPVRPEAVAAAVERWIVRPAAVAVTADDTTLPTDEEAPDALDQAQIDVLLSLDDGVGAVLSEVIEEYLTQTDETRGELIRGIEDTDALAFERAAHKLRGMCSNVGAAVLSTVCAEMETLGRLAQLDGAASLLERFDTEFARVRDALSRVATATTTVG
jgi:two-component system sensor histidine kinase/response regulator